MSKSRLIAIDPSLTSSGWALFCLQSGRMFGSGLVAPAGPAKHLAERMNELQRLISDLFESLSLGSGDYLVCEGPAPLVLNPNSATKVEAVRGIFETVARHRGAVVPGRLNPRTIQSELLGMRGKQLPRQQVKAWARETASRLFGEELKGSSVKGSRKTVSQDIIDAALIGVVARARIQFALRSKLNLYSVFSTEIKRSSSRTLRSWSEAEYVRQLAKPAR